MKPVYNPDQIVANLARWNVRMASTDINYTLATSTPPGHDGDAIWTGFYAFTAAQGASLRQALDALSDVTNVHFTQVADNHLETGQSNPRFAYGQTSSAAPYFTAATYVDVPDAAPYPAHLLYGSDILFNDKRAFGSFDPGTRNFMVLLHETQHALGVPHPGEYNRTPGVDLTYEANAEYFQDSLQYTVMSYFGEGETGANFGGGFALTPMRDDIAVLQALYGPNTTTRTGDTVYGFHATADRAAFDFTKTATPVFCIWDAGGADTLDCSGYTTASVIDLVPGDFSSVGGLISNVSIAFGAIVENAVGGAGSDRIFGNAVGNLLTGGGGDDLLAGGAGADTMVGGAGNDVYEVTDSGDVVTENAGEGVDTVVAYLSGYALGADVENLVLGGSIAAGNGNGGANALFGNAADNTLDGRGGDDLMAGGLGADQYIVTEAGDYVQESAGQGADMVLAFIDGYGLTANVENLSLQGAALVGFGNGGVNGLFGTAGNNTLIGGGGADTMAGGLGDDTYEVDTVGDTVIEAAGEGVDQVFSFAEGYALSANVENLILAGSTVTGFGGAGNNGVIGNAAANNLGGGGGDDTLIGNGGADTFFWTGTSAGKDIIADFDALGLEKIVVSQAIFTNMVVILNKSFQAGNDTVIAYDADTILVLKNVARNNLTAANFVFSSSAAGDEHPVAAEADGVRSAAAAADSHDLIGVSPIHAPVAPSQPSAFDWALA